VRKGVILRRYVNECDTSHQVQTLRRLQFASSAETEHQLVVGHSWRQLESRSHLHNADMDGKRHVPIAAVRS
jgi:hypothetical protein